MHRRWSGGGEPPMLKLARCAVVQNKSTDSESIELCTAVRFDSVILAVWVVVGVLTPSISDAPYSVLSSCIDDNTGWRVTRVVILMVGVLETSFSQALAVNEKTSLRRRVTRVVVQVVVVYEALFRQLLAVFKYGADTCRHMIGHRVRGVVPFAESNLGPPPLEGYISSDSVLHRLAVELYSIVYPALSTWEGIRGRMAANEAEWSLPLSEELPKGLSDESPGRVTREDSSEAVPSPEYIGRAACCPKYGGDVAFYEADLKAGLRFPIQPFVRELLDFLGLAPGQVNPNGWRTIIASMVMWRVSSNGSEDLTVDEFLFCYEPCQIALSRGSRGFWTFKNRDANTRIVQGLPSSDRIWKDKYFFVCGDNWERLPQEDPRDFVGVRRSWGTPSPSVLDRPLLNSVWQQRILRILDIEDRRYNVYIEPDLLATFSLGPVPNSTVKALVRANKKRVNTMKLNKSRLRQLAQSGEVAVEPLVLKRKRAGEGSSKQAEEPPTRPPPTQAVPLVQDSPPVIMVDLDLNPPSDPSMATISRSPHVAMDRAKAAVTTKDMDDYAAAHTEDVRILMVHSLMRRCIAAEEGLATLRAKYMADEAEMKNAKRAVLELTRERRDALDEVERLKKDLKLRDEDVKAAVEAKDKSAADFKHLVGQIEGAKEAAVSEFRASETFEDINTRYFLSGFEAFRKQAVQRFPGLDFSALQPYDDEDSVVDVSQDQAGDDDVSSK
uniref:Transposase (putative) gypsy type domain-containing protein n=1 Tax=Fagus sylvatica TaxID=28930 RepID=A0A2N9FI21_FAGSY